ncbi:fungal specific transcription factor domain-containing protein [Colletotrichum incanum]|uniref:Fungal specific transcription factor domain-containing protein n=1 Tax=Colletotrichum incanum TaxID=1573173 RepID=A0A161WHY9_COLIC|nr:fungal specific transcription factor domain-containing protein [Colletotrichum incanum]OHW94113.1 fungal specific transcription factor domain-containing protein [Colletotrichum incanum]
MSLLLTPRDRYASEAKASQACASCRKMKRKCDKSLPACGLCARMERRCDYAEPLPHPAPTADDFAALQLKLLDLESRLNQAGGTSSPSSTTNAVVSATGPGHSHSLHSVPGSASGSGGRDSSMEDTPIAAAAYTSVEPLWDQAPAAQYPPDVFLDISIFEILSQSLPRPVIDIPAEVLEQIGDGAAVQQTVNAYFAKIHTWLPIVSKKRMHMGTALAQGGPDLAMLFLAMRLATARPAPGVAPAHLGVYRAAKRFLSLLENGGATSLMVLQSMVLVAYFEYAHGVYPAAWLTIASCVRYADFLGLPGFREGNVLLRSPTTWTEMEERSRTWWAILVLDRIICLGNKKRYLSPEPQDNETFPVDDEAWDEGRVGRAAHHTITSSPPSSPSPFSSLCRSALLAGKVIAHIRKVISDHKQNPTASTVAALAEATSLSAALSSTAESLPRGIPFLAPRCVLISAAILLHDSYCCPAGPDGRLRSQEETAQQVHSVEAMTDASKDVAALAEELLLFIFSTEKEDSGDGHDLGDISPLILDALYGAASTLAWLVREEGSVQYEGGLNSIKRCLERLGVRWRLAGEYGRMLEQQEFAFMMQDKGHSTMRAM